MNLGRAACAVIVAMSAALGGAWAAEDVVIVYDASGSMWGQIDGVSKIEIARDVLADLVNEWSEETNLGLVAYGHRTEGNCSDIETLIAPGPVNRTDFINTVNAIQPRGKTPISAAVQHAADELSYRDNPATVVLISDGVETCNADPCALANQLAQQGVNFTAHVVGFDLDDEANERLACIAENTGGIFVPAQNAAELHDALAHVQSVLDLQPMELEAPQAKPEPAPEPEPEIVEAQIDVTAPEVITVGSVFPVAWSDAVNPRDYVTIVPMGADEGRYTNYARVEAKTEDRLTAPAEPGFYEVRYVLQENGKTLGSTPVEVVEAQVSVTAPEEVTTGTVFSVSWSSSVNPQDYVTIVPAGADEGTYTNYARVNANTEDRLTAPSDPGFYEVRYVLQEGRKTLAATPVEVVEAEVGIAAPEEVTVGASFMVSWSSSVNPQDYVTIVPAGAEEGTYTNYARVNANTEDRLTAPSDPGFYEVRYVLQEGRKTLAATPVEVVEAEVGIAAPEEVTVGASFVVSWSAPVNPQDYVTIVPAGADEGTYTNYARVNANTEDRLTAPSDPGFYEVRYVLQEGRKTLAATPVEVVAASVTITGPDVVRAETPVRVEWTGAVHPNDYVTIVPAGADPGSYGTYERVNDKSKVDLKAPSDPGFYEIRYILQEGSKTLASHDLEVVDASAALDDGAGLKVPSKAVAGETITISWTGGGTSDDQRITLARDDQADFSWIEAHRISGENSLQLKMPNEAGRYEVRFLDVSNRSVLGRAIVEVR